MQKNTYPFCRKDISDYSVIWTKGESFCGAMDSLQIGKTTERSSSKNTKYFSFVLREKDKNSQKIQRGSYFNVEVIGYSKINDSNSDKNHA